MPLTFVRPYQAVLRIVAAVWFIVTAFTLVAHYAVVHALSGEPEIVASPYLTTSDLVVIAALSGLIAIAATIPGCLIAIPRRVISRRVISATEPPDTTFPESTVQAERSVQDRAIEQLGQAFLAGMLIRITGTVALFLASSYYMEASPTRVGIWVLGWHAVLLLSEVIALSRQIPVS